MTSTAATSAISASNPSTRLSELLLFTSCVFALFGVFYGTHSVPDIFHWNSVRCAIIGVSQPRSNQQEGVSYIHIQGFSRVMTRPAGRVTRVSKCRGSGRVGSGQELNIFAGRVGWGQEDFQSRGSGWVGSKSFAISRVGSPVGSKRFRNLTGRVGSSRTKRSFYTSRTGSGQKAFEKCHGSGQRS